MNISNCFTGDRIARENALILPVRDGYSGKGRPLSKSMRIAIEQLSGVDMRDVKVHYNSALPDEINARAFAYGIDIYLGPGAEDTLAHEAWHVVQQKQGRVYSNGRLNGLPINDDPRLETEAEEMKIIINSAMMNRSLKPRRKLIHSKRILRPVIQFYIVVGDNTILTATALRDYLNTQLGITARNTTGLAEILNVLLKEQKRFADWPAVRAEVKRRSFGYKHVDKLEEILVENQDARDGFLKNMYQNETSSMSDNRRPAEQVWTNQRLSKIKQKNYRNKYIWPFLTWVKKVNFKQVNELLLEQDFARYLCGTHANPLKMNCWECVLFGAMEANLVTREYAIWAEQPEDYTSMGDSRVTAVKYVISIAEERDYPVYYRVINSADDPNSFTSQSTRFPKIPDRVPRGLIILFDRGAHVAISTGRMVPIESDQMRAVYGRQGHQVIELDGGTTTIEFSSIEDCLLNEGYRGRLDFGWLPNIPQNQRNRITKSVQQSVYKINDDLIKYLKKELFIYQINKSSTIEKLSNFSLGKDASPGLRKEGVPEEVIDKIEKHYIEGIRTEALFMTKMKEILGATDADRYKDVLVKYANIYGVNRISDEMVTNLETIEGSGSNNRFIETEEEFKNRLKALLGESTQDAVLKRIIKYSKKIEASGNFGKCKNLAKVSNKIYGWKALSDTIIYKTTIAGKDGKGALYLENRDNKPAIEKLARLNGQTSSIQLYNVNLADVPELYQ